MKTTYLQRAEMRRGLVCLVPLDDTGGLTCHEKTICDCEAIKLLDDIDTQTQRVAILEEALEFYAKGRSYENGEDDKPGFRREFGCGCCAGTVDESEMSDCDDIVIGLTARTALQRSKELGT